MLRLPLRALVLAIVISGAAYAPPAGAATRYQVGDCTVVATETRSEPLVTICPPFTP